MKTILVIAIVLFLFSCVQKRQNNYEQLIKGDWEMAHKDQEPEGYKAFLSFEDDGCAYWYRWEEPIRWKISINHLFIKNFPGKQTIRPMSYNILRLTADSLILSYTRYNKSKDTLRFEKVHTRNHITPAAIYFTSSGCFGSCPVMYMQIDSLGNVLFYGDAHTEKTGGYRSRISRGEYQAIVDKIRNLPLDTLKAFYEAPWTDDETRGIAIVTDSGKTIKTAAYGSYEEPAALRVLLNKLINLYHHIPLQADSTVTYAYFSSHPKQMPATELTIPPDYYDLKKFTPPKIAE